MYTLTNETTKTDILSNGPVEVVTNNLPACLSPDNTLLVEGHKKEYAIVGDALFASQNIGEAPQWLTSIIDSVIGTSLDSSLTSLVEAQRDLVTSIEELQIANNNYNEIVNIDATVDSAVTTRVAALNANIAQANATIAELQVTKVSADQASAVAMDVISSSLNDTAVGTIGGSVSQLNSSINTLAGSVSSTRTLVESRYGELNEGMADLQISVDSSIEGVKTAFTYDSVIKIGNNHYKSGFGLKAEATAGGIGTQADPYSSEFWIDATRFKFTNSNATGSVAPFTIDASGATPKIAFNGSVSFSSVTGDDKPEAGATRNIFRGPWLSGVTYNKGDIVTLDGDSWVADTVHTSTVGNKPGTDTTWRLLAAKGNSITTVNIYRRSATELVDSDKPSAVSTYNFLTNTVTGLNNSWTSKIPGGTDPLYVSVASVAAEGTTSTGTIEGSQWSTPVKYVENGLNTATVFVFKRTANNTAPQKPQGTSVYSFSTQSLTTTPTNDWAEDLPVTGGPYRWMSKATAASTSDTDNITDSEWSTPRLIAEDGIQGAEGSTGAAGQDAKAVKLIASNTVLKYSTAGKDPAPTEITFTAEPVNTSGTLMYCFYVDNVEKRAVSATSTFTYTALPTMSDTPISVEVELYEDSVLVARDEVTLISLRDGASTLSATLSNEAHVVPALSDGGSPTLNGSGTTLRVFEGIVPLTFKAFSDEYPLDDSRGTYNIERTFIGVEAPSLEGLNTTTVTQPDYTAMTADVGSVVFTIRVRRLDGTEETLTKVQTLSKSKQGVQGVQGAKGNTGAAGFNARSVDLIANVSAVAYNAEGTRVTNSVSFEAFAKGLTGTAFYRFYVDDVAQGAGATTTNTFTYTPPTTFADAPISIEVEVREGSDTGTIVARDEVTLARVKAGSDAIAATLSNEAHVFTADVSGVVSSYAGSGTNISVFQGATKLQYEAGTGSPTINGRFRVAITTTDITAGDVTLSSTDAIVANASNMTADVASLVYTINILNSNGVESTITKTQSFSKSKGGDTGPQGVQGPVGPQGQATYTWIRYADTLTGTGISNSPTGKAYIGFAYNKTTATESNTASDYTWSLIKGTDGVQGPPGADGKTTYTWIAYSDNADGNPMYQTPTTSTAYIGIAVNKTTAAESSNYLDYTWSKFKGDTGPQGAQGSTGASGQNAKAVKLVGSKTALKYSPAGDSPTPTSITFTAEPINTSGTLSYSFYVDDTRKVSKATKNTYTYSSPDTMSATPTSIEVELYEDDVLVARDEATVISLRDGASTVAATLSNEAHVVPSSASGDNPVLTGSGTTLRVFEGTAALTFVGIDNKYPSSNAKGTYNVERVLTGLTAPGLGGLDTTTLTQADYTGMTADVATAVFNIRIRRLDGTIEMLTKVQTLSKSKQGANGTNGTNGAQGASSIVIYRNETAKPTAPVDGSIPSGWSTVVSDSWTGNVWMCRGTTAVGSSSIVWGPVELDFTSWRKPNKTTIDGAYIETRTITAYQIAANTITADELSADYISIESGVVSDSFESTDYDPGVAGWHIDRDGSIECADLTARGDIEASSIKADAANIVSTLNIAGNAVRVAEFLTVSYSSGAASGNTSYNTDSKTLTFNGSASRSTIVFFTAHMLAAFNYPSVTRSRGFQLELMCNGSPVETVDMTETEYSATDGEVTDARYEKTWFFTHSHTLDSATYYVRIRNTGAVDGRIRRVDGKIVFDGAKA